jgi:hypothetical protein
MGALWNIFIMAGSVRSLLSLFDSSFDAAIAAMGSGRGSSLDDLYRTLPTIDFSRDLLEAHVNKLRVLRVPRCGWTDLGTPRRIGLMAQRIEEQRAALTQAPRATKVRPPFDLIDQYARARDQRQFDGLACVNDAISERAVHLP